MNKLRVSPTAGTLGATVKGLDLARARPGFSRPPGTHLIRQTPPNTVAPAILVFYCVPLTNRGVLI